jgi:hypothetical protein
VTSVTDLGTTDVAQINNLRELYLGGDKNTDQGAEAIKFVWLEGSVLRGSKGVTDGSIPYLEALLNPVSGTRLTPEVSRKAQFVYEDLYASGNFSASYTSFEGDRQWPTDGRKHKHPISDFH